MSLLFDTNIFLEILLLQDKKEQCKIALNDLLGAKYISDFSLHSIGVILFRKRKEDTFTKFVKDILPKIHIVGLKSSSYHDLTTVRDEYNLDFDDAYQYSVASQENLTIVTMDKDFARIRTGVNIHFI